MNIQASAICQNYDSAEFGCETRITKTLLRLGIPANTKGFHYILTAVLFGIENPIALTSMSKTLYPAIAERYSTANPNSIERAIRYSISQSCLRGDSEFICDLFGYTTSIKDYNPTNREFLAVISEYIKQSRMEVSGELIAS